MNGAEWGCAPSCVTPPALDCPCSSDECSSPQLIPSPLECSISWLSPNLTGGRQAQPPSSPHLPTAINRSQKTPQAQVRHGALLSLKHLYFRKTPFFTETPDEESGSIPASVQLSVPVPVQPPVPVLVQFPVPVPVQPPVPVLVQLPVPVLVQLPVPVPVNVQYQCQFQRQFNFQFQCQLTSGTSASSSASSTSSSSAS
ncbi:hypothetical protein FHG87_010936 [Trinorchestia longiramus]|nr:hypothetical protein FHG87_010936 [Trinorchestia longiramus]